ncbi:MAG TPA: hydroxyacylglutathione hydrolase family protein [Candidatus Latescibacteria bacterium]|mgnify:FL=1|nr:hydroxyacylglutathione hydrolase family protein [Candidatus Latescibacterota bacterium]
MLVEQIRTGGDRNFSYLVADETRRVCAVVDPSFAPDLVAEKAATLGFRVEYVLVTHDHFDHTNGNARLKELTGAQVVMHRMSEENCDVRVDNGDVLPLGALSITVIHTPGHTRGHACYLVEDAVFTGDTLFVGKVGGSDFGEGARQEWESLHTRLLSLPDNTRVFPGHDYGVRPFSTIGDERRSNPFLLQPDFPSFLKLKMNWAEYKKLHGIK